MLEATTTTQEARLRKYRCSRCWQEFAQTLLVVVVEQGILGKSNGFRCPPCQQADPLPLSDWVDPKILEKQAKALEKSQKGRKTDGNSKNDASDGAGTGGTASRRSQRGFL